MYFVNFIVTLERYFPQGKRNMRPAVKQIHRNTFKRVALKITEETV